MKVTDFAKRAGVGPDVVRYYVREGLLAPSRNPANGYKLFGSPQLARIRFIRKVQGLGFTLSEIGQGYRNSRCAWCWATSDLGCAGAGSRLMKRMDAGDCPCEDMRQQLRGKIVENQIKLRDMQERQAFMERAYANWDRAGNDVGELCRLLEGV